MLREPLVQFLLLGAGLFALYSLVAVDTGARRDRIVVDAGQVTRLAQQFQRTWMRPPTRDELNGLIQDHVKEEVFYREALALGLDKDDLVIRRRMRQKLEFLNEDIVERRQPTDAELQALLDTSPDQFRIPARLTIRQVFVRPELHGPDASEYASELLARLEAAADDASIAETLGDATLLPYALSDATVNEIARRFGGSFATELEKAPVDRWVGPIASSYGLHLVRVTAREPGRVPPLSEVRAVVVREWSAARRAEASEAFFAALRKRYEISIEMPGGTAGEARSAGRP